MYTFTCVVAILDSECYRLTLSPGGPGGPSFPAVPCNTNKSSSVNIYHIRVSLQCVYLAWATMGAVEGGHHVLLDRIMPSKKSKISVGVGVPWDLVSQSDLWLLDPHEDPTERVKPKAW